MMNMGCFSREKSARPHKLAAMLRHGTSVAAGAWHAD
jgi:hypothetical protein